MLKILPHNAHFANATCILRERGTNIVNNTMMVLASHPPNIINIIPLKGR
jgi:hypothetical protein